MTRTILITICVDRVLLTACRWEPVMLLLDLLEGSIQGPLQRMIWPQC